MKRNNTTFLLYILIFLNAVVRQSDSHQKRDVCSSTQSGEAPNLYHPSTQKCYKFATRGPCGENMIFYKHPLHSKYGFCDCDQGVRSQYPCTDHPVRKMFYFPNLRKCFPLYSQANCAEGLWLSYDTKSSGVKCLPNLCIPTQIKQDPNYDWKGSSSKFWFYDPLRKSCFLSQTRGYCPVGLALEITHESHLPKCKQTICYSKLTNFRSDLTCRRGSRYSYLWRGCVKKTVRNFYGIG